MKFLRANDEVHVRHPVDQLLSAALRHATQETKDHIRPTASGLRDQVLHFVQRLLLRHVAHAARIQQNYIGDMFRRCEGIALGHELGGDGLAVALVHLATVGFDIDTRHDLKRGEITLPARGLESAKDKSQFSSSKLQRSSKVQIPIGTGSLPECSWQIGAWSLGFLWNLGFGAWSL